VVVVVALFGFGFGAGTGRVGRGAKSNPRSQPTTPKHLPTSNPNATRIWSSGTKQAAGIMNNLVCIRSSTIKSMVLRLHRCRVVPKVAGGMPLPRTRPLPSHRPIATSAVMAFPYSARSPLCHHFAAGFSPLTPSSYNCNYYSSTTIVSTRQPKTTKRIPRKAALALTPKARNIFRQLIAATGSQGIILKYEISSQHALRMAFKFDLIKDASKELSELDEG
jgi:hypothetical protein